MITKEKQDAVQHLRVLGATQAEIAVKLDICPSSVRRILQRQGILPRQYRSHASEHLAQLAVQLVQGDAERISDHTKKLFEKVINHA